MEENKNSLLKSIVDLIELLIAFIRQELKSAVDSGLAEPLKKAGKKTGIAIAVGFIMGIAAIFIAVGLFQLVATLVGATWIAYLIIGVLLIIFGVIVSVGSRGT